MPRIHTHEQAIGRKAKSANSNRPNESQRKPNTIAPHTQPIRLKSTERPRTPLSFIVRTVKAKPVPVRSARAFSLCATLSACLCGTVSTRVTRHRPSRSTISASHCARPKRSTSARASGVPALRTVAKKSANVAGRTPRRSASCANSVVSRGALRCANACHARSRRTCSSADGRKRSALTSVFTVPRRRSGSMSRPSASDRRKASSSVRPVAVTYTGSVSSLPPRSFTISANSSRCSGRI